MLVVVFLESDFITMLAQIAAQYGDDGGQDNIPCPDPVLGAAVGMDAIDEGHSLSLIN